MSRYFKEFFVCPYCGDPQASKEELESLMLRGQYCGVCGKRIADALAEALAEVQTKKWETNKHPFKYGFGEGPFGCGGCGGCEVDSEADCRNEFTNCCS